MPKLKTSRAAAKRFKKTGTGKLVRNKAYKSHILTKKSTKNRRLMLETEYGAKYIVSYDDIIWVRNGKRWPKGVYKLLKGTGGKNGKEQE